jgi:hypothetical protein
MEIFVKNIGEMSLKCLIVKEIIICQFKYILWSLFNDIYKNHYWYKNAYHITLNF